MLHFTEFVTVAKRLRLLAILAGLIIYSHTRARTHIVIIRFTRGDPRLRRAGFIALRFAIAARFII